MDKYFRPSLTDLNRHAFKAEARKIAEQGVEEEKPEEKKEETLTDLTLPPRVRFFRAGEEKPKD